MPQQKAAAGFRCTYAWTATLLLVLLAPSVSAAAATHQQQQPSKPAATATAAAFPPTTAAPVPAPTPPSREAPATPQQQFTEPSTVAPLAEPPASHSPQSVAQVLLGHLQTYAGPMIKAAQNLFSFGLRQAEFSPVQLPQCQQTNVLLRSGHFPAGTWGTLTAEQQTLHPINMVMLQLAYMAYRPFNDVASCLTGMGADMSTLQNFTMPVSDFNTQKTAYVFRAGKERVFVLIRGSSETDIAINIACRQEHLAHDMFGVGPGPQIKVHRGYWRAWGTLEAGVIGAVQSLLKEVPSKEVYIVGHSLGAAMGSVAAMRMNVLLPKGVSGAWLFAAPRAGNAAWAAAYNKLLLHKTIRFSNYLDFAVRVPAASQSCSLGSMSLQADTGRFDYAHVGRSVLMCPDHSSGLTQFRVSPNGSEALDCFGNDDVDATAATHQLGSYFDAWRRGLYKYTGTSMPNDIRVQAVLCEGCTVKTARFRMEQIRDPARPGGPVTCAVDASCSSDAAFNAALSVGNITTSRFFSNFTTCSAYMCTRVGDVRA